VIFDETATVLCEHSAVADARHRVVGWSQLCEAPVDPEVLALLVSEVVTNAVLHGCPPCEVRVTWDESVLRVEVRDAGVGQAPRAVDRGVSSESGRGLLLVETLSDRWGVDVTKRSTCIWFEVGLPTDPGS